MKILKLNHEQAKLVEAGKKTTSIRMFDDKAMAVGDEVELLDKVDSKDRSTWRPIGIGKIEKIIEKRLGSIHESDLGDHEAYTSHEDTLREFRNYYGESVTLDTPVKILHFSYTPLAKIEAPEPPLETSRSSVKEVKMYSDGGSRGNPGPSASGYVVYDMDDVILTRQGVYIGITTNNQAEYLSLKFGLQEALKLQARIVHVYMDSLLVVNQMTGKFKVKNRDLWPIYEAVKELVPQFEKVTFTHVPRELNKEADAAVNEAMDAAIANN
jgi:ribonuclease HI